ncbi:serine/threonine-protein kinase [Streptomyces sp. NPDC057293]|uniref:serine/threonine-protein kinase n=1 Tax=unclassified Streptomyces TaxID=2593676 RepID=UPI00364001B7
MLTGVPDQQAGGGPGRLIAGRYLLHEVLGRGGMGVVWRAHDQLLDRPVAAKELHIAAGGDEDRRTRMRRAVREARAVARVPHPHVVGVHDLVEFEDRLWIVMELVSGPSLAAHLSRSGPLTPEHTARLGLQLLDALRAVHLAGALHRDVKPANVLLRPDGSAVLTDFGIAALDEDGEPVTSAVQLMGSVEYMAPERATAQEAGPASDLWSLGATLVTVCGGESPFRRPARTATLHAVVYGKPRLPERLGALRPVVEALLHRDPRERPTADELAVALRSVAEGAAGGGAVPSEAVTVPVSPVSPVPAYSARAGDTLTAPPLALGGTAGRAVGTTSAPPPARRGGAGRWLAGTLGGAAALVAVVSGGLLLAGVAPFQDDGRGADQDADQGAAEVPVPAPTSRASPVGAPQVTSYEVVVSADGGWQPVAGAVVRAGDTVTVRSGQGEWTVDRARMPMTGPAGYAPDSDRDLDFADDCKVVPDAPFGALVTRLSDTDDAPVLAVGEAKTFRAGGDGVVQLRINDGEGCVDDNAGEVAVVVEVSHEP